MEFYIWLFVAVAAALAYPVWAITQEVMIAFEEGDRSTAWSMIAAVVGVAFVPTLLALVGLLV